MKARRVALLIAAASAVAILGVLPTVTKHQCYKRSLFEIERQHFDSVLKRRGLSGYYVFGLRRSKSANEVYVYLDGQMLQPKVICLSDRRWKVLNGLGRMSYFDEDGRVVASFNDLRAGITLRDGSTLPLTPFALFDVDYGGDYYVIGHKPFRAEIGRLSSPGRTLLVVSNFLANRIFFGRWRNLFGRLDV